MHAKISRAAAGTPVTVSGMPRQSRRAVLWSLGIVVSLQLALVVAMFWWIPGLRDPHYAWKVQCLRQRMQHAMGSASKPKLVVMLGSSRTALGFHADLLDEPLTQQLGQSVVVFNFGMTGAGPVTERLNLKRLLAEGIRPDLLLVEVLAPSLGDAERLPVEARLLNAERLWLDEVGILEKIDYPTQRLRKRWWQSWLAPWYTHRFAIMTQVDRECLPAGIRTDWSEVYGPSGWAPNPFPGATPEFRQRALEHARNEYAGLLEGFRLGGPTSKAVREILEVCRAERIRAALVLMPESPTFRSWYPDGVWEQIIAHVEDLRREYAVPIVNGQCWMDEPDFLDGHHLVEEGADRFTERLGQDAIVPMLQDPAISP